MKQKNVADFEGDGNPALTPYRMRDPARIDRIIEKLRTEWHTQPDTRLTQLVHNLITAGRMRTGRTVLDPAPVFFYTEDDAVEKYLDEERSIADCIKKEHTDPI